MHEPQYVRTPEGVRFRDTQGRLGPTLQEGLALMYDREEGVVMRHGDAPEVDEHYRRIIAALAGTTLPPELVMLVIDLDQLTDALLAEVNRALPISGYLKENATRLGAPRAD